MQTTLYYLLDISRQLEGMKLGSTGKISAYTVLLGLCMPVARLPSSYMPFVYIYYII